MKKLTSASANKLLRSLEEEKRYLLEMESEAEMYILAEGEKSEPPEYDYREMNEKIDALDAKIRVLKHAVNIFNTTTKLEEQGITVDEALVKMAQLNRKKEKLDWMRRRLPKARKENSSSMNFIEYVYLNYDLGQVQKDYHQVSQEIIQIQLELDTVNQTVLFEVDID